MTRFKRDDGALCHPITKGDCMFSNTSFNSVTSSDKQAVKLIGSDQPILVDSNKNRPNNVEQGKRCICQLLNRNDQFIPIQLEEEILELSNRSSAF